MTKRRLAEAIHYFAKKIRLSDLTDRELAYFRLMVNDANKVLADTRHPKQESPS